MGVFTIVLSIVVVVLGIAWEIAHESKAIQEKIDSSKKEILQRLSEK